MKNQKVITIRKSDKNDLSEILLIFDSARKYMRANNNNSQWNDEYPGEKDIINDIKEGNSYVGLNEKGEFVLTFAFIIGDDPTYKIIHDGNWLNDNSYGTIHRIASNGKTGNVLKRACEYCFQFIENIRIDTHEDNKPMLNALERLRFVKCGTIICRDGTPRIAFQAIKN